MINAHTKIFAIAVLAASTLVVPAFAAEQSDSVIKQAIISQSIANYSGSCPCPFNTARNGSSCDKRSAYSRPGGAAPICYEKDITPAMIQDYKNQHKN